MLCNGIDISNFLCVDNKWVILTLMWLWLNEKFIVCGYNDLFWIWFIYD